jgi:glycosyltransferase involved in cell wall biosynthesis
MACGLPVVASPAGVNREIVTHGETGFLAEKTSDWVQALETLGRNMDLRISMGRKARQCVEQKYSLQVTAPRVYSMLMSAARGRL